MTTMYKERNQAPLKVKNAVGEVGRLACNPATTAACLEGVAGYNLAQDDYLRTGIAAAAGAAVLVLDGLERRRREAVQRDIGRMEGIAAGAGVRGLLGRAGMIVMERPEDGAPLYMSLDSTRAIQDPDELLDSLGDGPEAAARRIGIILRHAEKRELNADEVETLRRAEAALHLMPGFEAMLCDDGQDLVEQLHETVGMYEERHRQTSVPLEQDEIRHECDSGSGTS